MKMSQPVSEIHERFNEPKPVAIPAGTIEFQRAEEDDKPHIFGVREILRTSSDGTILVNFGENSQSIDDTRVRLKEDKLTAEGLNEIRITLRELIQILAQYESVPRILKPVGKLENELRILTSSSIREMLEGNTTDDDAIQRTMKELGVLTERLLEGGPRTLKEIRRHFKTLFQLGVLYFVVKGSKYDVERSFSYYGEKLKALEAAA